MATDYPQESDLPERPRTEPTPGRPSPGAKADLLDSAGRKEPLPAAGQSDEPHDDTTPERSEENSERRPSSSTVDPTVETKADLLDRLPGHESSETSKPARPAEDQKQDAPDNPRLSVPQRLDEVYRRLDRLPPAASADQALDQLNGTLNEVEDEHSGVPRNPNPGLKFDGRMYPPREDFVERRQDGGLTATTKGNIIEIDADGATRIFSRRTHEIVYNRPGSEG